MNILFLDAYFYPENIAFSHLERDIMEGLIRCGHSIRVVCPTPSRGLDPEQIKRYRKIKAETVDDVEIRRYTAPAEGKNPLLRAVRYFWCNLREYAVGKRYRDADLVFAVSTPPTQGRVAGKLAKKLGIPFVYSIQDLFPDSLVSSGLSKKNSLLYRLGERMERKTYRSASEIIVLSDTMYKIVQSRGVAPEKLTAVSNWIDADEVVPVAKDENPLFEEYDIDRRKFNVVYAGNFGASQGADVILKAADLLREDKEIAFVIFGGGAEFERAKALCDELRLDNVKIYPLLPAERTAQVYSLGDIALITCKAGVGETAVPSKLWSIMACNTPIIASFDTDSELARILADSGGGVCVEPENAAALAAAIRQAYREHRSGSEKAAAARDYVIKNASKSISVQKYIDRIEKTTL